MSAVSVKVEFGGGLELLFSNQRSHKLDIPAIVPPPAEGKENDDKKPIGRPADITYLMYWLRDNLLKERVELFIENGTVYALFGSLTKVH
ncbi:hypothetical protein EIP86_001568 [Pleurotus ostreatoroseus]|nr:hypothetical protein EIP86_001568 [Pleurotus ostreatoroseus]